MNRLERTFRSSDHMAFVAFLVAGDPNYSASLTYAKAIIEAGADVLELGMPFSDPIGDGPIIQRADERSLAAGITPNHLFSLIREIRSTSEVPLVILSYFNSVYIRGLKQFYQEAAEAGADAILIVDLPLEESDEVVQAAEETNIASVFLVAETTTDSRLAGIASRAGGFLYLISKPGVTGMRKDSFPQIKDFIRRVRAISLIPIAVGFGISRPEQVQSLRNWGADAVIVGSAIVQQIQESGDDVEKGCREITAYIRRMRQACDHEFGRR